MKRRSVMCYFLEFISWVLIMTIILIFTDNIVFIVLGCFLCGCTYLYFENLSSKGKFMKIDEKIYNTKIYILFKKYNKIVYFILFVIALSLTALLFL